MYLYTKETVASHIVKLTQRKIHVYSTSKDTVASFLLFTLYVLCMSKVSKEAQNIL